jgi:hypothetical protein
MLLALDLYLTAAVGRSQARPAVSRWEAWPRATEFVDFPAEELLIEAC